VRFATRCIHAGQDPDPLTGSVTFPIYLTSTFVQEEPGKHKGFVYSRTGNPTRSALEQNIAALEDGKQGLAFASGLAASTAIAGLLRPGDHLLISDDVYGGVYRLVDRFLREWGIQVSFVDATDMDAMRRSFRKDTRMVWIETPSNPLMKVIDIEAVAALAEQNGSLLVVDNTFASPYIQNPLKLGAHIVFHSTTKYLGGHSDIVGGAIVTSDDSIYERLKFLQNTFGGVPSPFDCWLVLRGIKTLHVRMERHSSNAQRLADYLASHRQVKEVYYPGLASHPQHDIAKRQMRRFGGMMSFRLKGGAHESARFLKSLKIIALAESLGGVESLAECPALMTHASIPREKRIALGITEDLIRLSVGIEDVEDLMEDLEQALAMI
jgi:cystathionine beta-lyase/cystathionine gamma-synthase